MAARCRFPPALVRWSLVLLAAPGAVYAMQPPSTRPVPLELVLTRECGEDKREALATFRGRPLRWCTYDATRLMASSTDLAALAGRRLYVRIDAGPAGTPVLPVALNLTAFSAGGQVTTHIGATFTIADGRFEASIYDARALRVALDALQRQGARRWIIDLREHQGGTLFPPVAALRPLLGGGALGYFIDADGKQHGRDDRDRRPRPCARAQLRVADRGFHHGGQRRARSPREFLRLPGQPYSRAQWLAHFSEAGAGRERR